MMREIALRNGKKDERMKKREKETERERERSQHDPINVIRSARAISTFLFVMRDLIDKPRSCYCVFRTWKVRLTRGYCAASSPPDFCTCCKLASLCMSPHRISTVRKYSPADRLSARNSHLPYPVARSI